MPYVLSVLLDEDLLALNRAVGIVRRRNLAVESLAVGPAQLAGTAQVTVVVRAEEPVLERLAAQLRKMVGVRRVELFRSEDGVVRELALIRTAAPPARRAELAAVASLFGGTVLEEGDGEVIVQAAGSNAFIRSLIRALEPFGITDVARSGAVALERGNGTAGAFSLAGGESS